MAIAVGRPQPSGSTVEFSQCKVRTESPQTNREHLRIEQLLQPAGLTRVRRDHNTKKSQTGGYGLATKTGSRREARRQNEGPGGATGALLAPGGWSQKDGNVSEQVCCGRASGLGGFSRSVLKQEVPHAEV